MNGRARTGWLGLAAAAAAATALAQDGGGETGKGRLLTLETSAMESALERVNLRLPFANNLPDLRVKVEQPEAFRLDPELLEPRVRGVEFSLPMEGAWLGYEWAGDGEDPRATFSIRRGF